MHEASIASRIITIVESELASRGVTAPVEKIRLRAGKLNAIVPDSLSFHFDVQKRDKPQLAETVLEVLESPIIAVCEGCGREARLDAPLFICETCSGTLTPKSGTELLVESISVRD
ncbi:MAG: hydrogenase maturation nickel metallochaperone HypA [Oligoflexia bacterium]|nr:hydrogenase maturation nickel metallochaperone HypA [Oligoflexia bacterium]